jgi:hypothetical protein
MLWLFYTYGIFIHNKKTISVKFKRYFLSSYFCLAYWVLMYYINSVCFFHWTYLWSRFHIVGHCIWNWNGTWTFYHVSKDTHKKVWSPWAEKVETMRFETRGVNLPEHLRRNSCSQSHTIFSVALKELVVVCLHVCIMLYPYERNLFIIHEKSLSVDMSIIFARGGVFEINIKIPTIKTMSETSFDLFEMF